MSPPSLGLVVQNGAQACSSGHGDNSVRSQMPDLTLVGALTFITRARPARAANSSRPISEWSVRRDSSLSVRQVAARAASWTRRTDPISEMRWTPLSS